MSQALLRPARMETPCRRRVSPPSPSSFPFLPFKTKTKLYDYSLKQEQLRTAKKKDKKHHQTTDLSASSTRKSEPGDSRKHLQGVRVTQKNLVYVIGLTLKIINDEALALLRGQEYFGQYGKIQKIMINKRKDIPPLRGGSFDKPGGASVSVYVTFARKDDAVKCIAALDSASVDGNTLRAAYGTTKYCTAFLQHRQCQNPNCMYLHSEQDQDDTESHTREETATIQHAAKMGQHPPSAGKTPATTTPRPPPPTEDKPERPILPTSVSWARAAVGARAHSPPQERIQQTQSDRRQSIPPSIPTQPSPISTTPEPQVQSPAPSIEMPPTATDLVTPSEISLTLATSDQRSRHAIRVFDKILENFQKGSFKFGFASDLVETDEYKLACQVSPYFRFKKDGEGSASEGGEDVEAAKEGEGKGQEASYSPKPRGFDPFASTMENGTHKRQQSRFAYVNDPISKALAQPVASTGPQTQLVRTFSPPTAAGARGMMSSEPMYNHHLQGAASAASATGSTAQGIQYKTATPPPPGMYLSHAQQFEVHRRQQLHDQARMANYNPEYGYYPQQQQTQGGAAGPAARNYGNAYDDGDHAGVYAPQARRHLLDNQGPVPSRRHRRDLPLTTVDSLQDLSGSLMNMRMSPHLSQGFGGSGQQHPLPQSYAAGQNAFGGGRRYMGNAF